MSLIPVHPDSLHEVWDVVLPGIRKIASRCHWLPEDVYLGVKTNAATLHLGYSEGEYLGFVVLTPMKDFDGPVLNVWLAYAEKPVDTLPFLAEIRELAKSMGAKRIQFSSERKGWERASLRYGFRKTRTIYELEV